MKKTYQHPMTIVVAVAASRHLMDNSIKLNSSEATTNNVTNEYETLSRRSHHSVWDEDEEE